MRIEDLDGGVRDKIVEDFSFNDEVGEKVPIVVNFDIDRYGMYVSMAEAMAQRDFINFMQNSSGVNDKVRRLEFPFMVLSKNPDIIKGTRFSNSHSNIPFDVNYPVFVEKFMEGGKLMGREYSIKQPIHVDIKYVLYMFTTDPIELQRFGSIVLRKFQSTQYYVSPNGHYMPLSLESSSDDSQIDLDSRQFYVSKVEMLLQGYLIEEVEMRIVPLLNAVSIQVENTFQKSSQNAFKDLLNVNGTFEILFGRKSPNIYEFIATKQVDFTRINISDKNKYLIFVNNEQVHLPFSIKQWDLVQIGHLFGDSKPIKLILYAK